MSQGTTDRLESVKEKLIAGVNAVNVTDMGREEDSDRAIKLYVGKHADTNEDVQVAIRHAGGINLTITYIPELTGWQQALRRDSRQGHRHEGKVSDGLHELRILEGERGSRGSKPRALGGCTSLTMIALPSSDRPTDIHHRGSLRLATITSPSKRHKIGPTSTSTACEMADAEDFDPNDFDSDDQDFGEKPSREFSKAISGGSI
ncbi:unnamed protein product [Zymoseptoria tritici ST99CH_3D1]|nr:unnamed protein product [Zymoseptoria tritici ST99CH_3D1]